MNDTESNRLPTPSAIPLEPFMQGKRRRTYLSLKVMCARDATHLLGEVHYMLMEQFPHAGEIRVAAGKLRWDDSGNRLTADCPSCAPQGKGRDQRMGRARVEKKLAEMFQERRHADRIQM
jgi:hypothetical protein